MFGSGSSFGLFSFAACWQFLELSTIFCPPRETQLIIHGRLFFDYLYFEVITFTTVGYGDIIPTTVQGKLFAMCTALLGATHGTFVAIILQALSHPSPGNDD